MRGERLLLRIGEYLVSRACQRLPQDVQEERYREWAAELPAILHDPQVRFAPRRAARMLAYAADTLRTTIMTPGTARSRTSRLSAAFDLLFLVVGVAGVAFYIWAIVQAPRDGQSYLRLAWGLLFVAYLLRKRVRSGGSVTTLLIISATLALGTVYLWSAVQAPGDWVNYLLAALLLLLALVSLLLTWWLGRLGARTGGRHAAPCDPGTFTR